MQPNQRKIPTILALVALVVMIVGAAVLTTQIQKIRQLTTSASQPESPENVAVASVTDVSAAIYWTTQKETQGAVLFGRSTSLGEGIAIDERDTSKSGSYTTHLARLVNLKPSTTYYFKISSGANIYGDPTGTVYKLETGPTLDSFSSAEPLYGKLTTDGKTADSGAIVVWTAVGSAPIVALSKSDGSFVFPVATARSDDLLDSFQIKPGLSETISYLTKDGPSGSMSCVIGSDNPLPVGTIGQNDNCQTAKSQTTPTQSAHFNPPKAVNSGDLTIDLSEGEQVSTPMPVFSGNAPAGVLLKIEINGKNKYSGSLKVPQNGLWSWSPPANLSAGANSVTVTVTLPTGVQSKITRNFTVPGNDLVLGISTGTPSAQTSHLDCVSNACVSISGAGSNTCSTDSDCAPVTPPVSTPAATTPPPPAPPVTGSSDNTLFALTWAMVFLTLGVGSFFLVVKK